MNVPYETCSWPARLSLSFCNPVLAKGYTGGITEADIWPISPTLACRTFADTMDDAWKHELETHGEMHASTLRMVLRIHGAEIIRQALLALLWVSFVVIGPALFVPAILEFLQDLTVVPFIGWIFAVCLFLSLVISNVVNSNTLWQNAILGARVRSSVTALLIRKISRLRDSENVAGGILNFSSNDLQRVFLMFLFTPVLAGGIGGVIGIVAALLARYGLAGVAPSVILLLSFPANRVASKFAANFSRQVLPVTDKRVKLMGEIIRSISAVKLYGWESLFCSAIDDIRTLELKKRLSSARAAAALESLALVTIIVSSVLYVLSLTFLGRPFTASTVFTGISLILISRIPLVQLQLFSQYAGESKVCFSRLKDILLLPEQNDDGSKAEASEVFVEGRSGSTIQVGEDFEIELQDFKFQKGVVGILGEVGSGKSTFLLGCIRALEGLVVSGTNSFSPNPSFIINATLKENIVFGLEFNESKYRDTIRRCCLQPDLEQLVNGDETEIGAFGVNLSGGQKARVSLARAMYSDRQILVLDDPLSALDANVGAQVFESIREGLGDKLVIVATHQLQYASRFDQLLVLKEGKIAQIGTFDECMMHPESELARMMEQKEHQETDAGAGATQALTRKRETLKRSSGTNKEVVAKSGTARKLIQEETSQTGKVSSKVYRDWIAGFGWLVIWVVAIALLSFGLQAFIDFWLRFWIDGAFAGFSSQLYLGIYALLAALAIVLYALYLQLYWPLALKSAGNLHDKVFRRMMKGKISWFEATPEGRILNRFAKDVDVVDQQLPESVKVFVGNAIQLVSFVAVISVAFPFFLIALGPLCLLFFLITRYFTRANRQIRRIEGVARSPVFSGLGNLLTGLVSLRTFGQTDTFIDQLHSNVDGYTSAVVMFWSTSRWLGLRLDLLCSIIVLVASIIAVALRGSIPASTAGIAITYSMRLGSFLQWTFRNKAILESSATSAERLIEFTQLPVEDDSATMDPPKDWPSRGLISFDSVVYKYAADLPPALSGLSFKVLAGEHIGICGRTGAGKSSLVGSLFRMRELAAGTIRVDGVDIASLPLTFRKSISIITQESTLFSGPVRFSLDPYREHSNESIWEALALVELSSMVEQNGGLEDFILTEGGSNLSSGERQLLCLVRVILKKDKRILIMDEATASIDQASDELVQRIIQTQFSGLTILSIAHRLGTIIDADKVLLLENGKVREFDSPKKLVSDASLFRDLVLDTGAESSRSLIRTATERTVLQVAVVDEDVEYDFEDDFDRIQVIL